MLTSTKHFDQLGYFLTNIGSFSLQSDLISPRYCFTEASADRARKEKGSGGLCWHAAGYVWLDPTEVNSTAVVWMTPSVCDRPARAGCLWHFHDTPPICAWVQFRCRSAQHTPQRPRWPSFVQGLFSYSVVTSQCRVVVWAVRHSAR